MFVSTTCNKWWLKARKGTIPRINQNTTPFYPTQTYQRTLHLTIDGRGREAKWEIRCLGASCQVRWEELNSLCWSPYKRLRRVHTVDKLPFNKRGDGWSDRSRLRPLRLLTAQLEVGGSEWGGGFAANLIKYHRWCVNVGQSSEHVHRIPTQAEDGILILKIWRFI